MPYKIEMTCPECGNSVWHKDPDEDAFECAICGVFSTTEEMGAEAVEEAAEVSLNGGFPVVAKIRAELTQEDIDDIMVSALEGGINYWCCEAEVVEKKRVADWGHEQIARGGMLILHDMESEDKWELTLEKLLAGFKKYLENGHNLSIQEGRIDTCEIDGEAADCIVQYALFNELVFG